MQYIETSMYNVYVYILLYRYIDLKKQAINLSNCCVYSIFFFLLFAYFAIGHAHRKHIKLFQRGHNTYASITYTTLVWKIKRSKKWQINSIFRSIFHIPLYIIIWAKNSFDATLDLSYKYLICHFHHHSLNERMPFRFNFARHAHVSNTFIFHSDFLQNNEIIYYYIILLMITIVRVHTWFMLN